MTGNEKPRLSICIGASPPIRERDESALVVELSAGCAAAGAVHATVTTTARTLKRAMRDPPSIPVDKPLVGKESSSRVWNATLRDTRLPHERHEQSDFLPLGTRSRIPAPEGN
jgi:hypothetical protein